MMNLYICFIVLMLIIDVVVTVRAFIIANDNNINGKEYRKLSILYSSIIFLWVIIFLSAVLNYS